MLQSDSRKVKDGDTFIALKGYKEDGHKYILDAINNGAKKVIAERGKYDVETLIVDDTNEYLYKYFKINNIDIKLIGVTGTNGKTTTCYLLYQLLNGLGCKCAYIGTIGYIVDDVVTSLDNTTPGSLELYNLLEDSYNHNCEYVVMEVSSQALDQKRVDYLEFDAAIFTNLTRDHLDYHKTLENYIEAKRKLFYLLKDDGISLINNDDPYADNFKIKNYKTYGFTDSDYTIDDENVINSHPYNIPLIGKYNKYNTLAAISLLYELGYQYDDIKELVQNLKEPSGRMEVINYKTNRIIIDYAHTPDALQNVINTSLELTDGHVYVIIGCGGNRDKGKRKMMGLIATDMAYYTIFTSDNPRDEDPLDIIKDMTSNLDKDNYQIEVNRENAIKKGIQLLNNNDILLVLGKGHEKYQIIGSERLPFDDKQIVLDNI